MINTQVIVAPRIRPIRWSYLPPLMVYLAAGLSGLTNVVAIFYVKDYLGLSAEYIAALGFWISLPWSLKMVLGHLVDLIWRHKAWLVLIGAALVFASLVIMLGLLTDRDAFTAWLPAETWYVLSALLAPIGYVLQDVVADAMTIEAVPRGHNDGSPISEAESKSMHTTMQALARGTLIIGILLVSAINLLLFEGADELKSGQRLALYADVYRLSLFIPAVSVLGVALASRQRRRGRSARGPEVAPARPRTDRWIVGGGIAFAIVSGWVGVSGRPHAELLVFLLSLAIVVAVMRKLLANIEPSARQALVGTATVLFVFRAMPDPGPGPTWWMIDRLGVDEAFFAVLSMIGSVLAICGLFAFRRLMAERSVTFTIVALTIVWTVISLPMVGLYYGFHEWTAAHTGGIIDGRAIVVADTSLLALLSEIAMVPMLAWVARTAPDHLKATYFAVMVSFTNLGFLLSRLGSEYLNRVFVVTRETRDPVSGAILTQADYSDLGPLHLTSITIVFFVPLLAILLLRMTRFRSM